MLIEERYAEILSALDEVDRFRDELIRRLGGVRFLHPLRLSKAVWNIHSPGNPLQEDLQGWLRELLVSAATPAQKEHPCFPFVTHAHSRELLARELICRYRLHPGEIGHLRKLNELKGQRMNRFAKAGTCGTALAAIGILTRTLPKEVLTALGINYVSFHLVILLFVIIASLFVAATTYSGVRDYQDARLRHDRFSIMLGYIEIVLERDPELSAPLSIPHDACLTSLCGA